MSFDAVQERLAALQETTAQVKELIDRLATLNFQPGSVPLGNGKDDDDDDDENVATELSAEINQILREEEEDLELLVEELTDLRGGKEGSETARRKERLREGVERLEGDVKSCRISFHKAQLSARRSLDAARRLERQILLQSYTRAPSSTPSRSGANSPAPSLRRRHTLHKQHAKNDDPVVAASSDLTQSLHRARQIVQDELARSMALHDTLGESTKQLQSLGSTYGRMEDMLTSSKDLLGVLMKSTKSDTWYLETTFYMLAATLGWLVFRRWLYGPMWWLVWLPLRLVFRTGSTAVGIIGSGSESGSGATMEVVDGSSGKTVAVDMGSQGEAAVPTAQVGQQEKQEQGTVDDDSMVEMVGRIIDNLPPEEEGSGEEQQQQLEEHVVFDQQQERVTQRDTQPIRDEL